jgi:hypothetical protein
MLDKVRQHDEPLPHECAWLGGGQSYVVCAFYTDNYLPRAMALKASLEAQRTNYYLKRYDSKGSWAATTRLKPSFIRHCLERFPQLDTVYVDADSIVRRPLTFIDRISTDVGLWLHSRKRKGRWYLRISAGVVYVRNSEAGRRFVQGWMNPKLDRGALAVDEDMLQAAFGEFEGLSITVLPAACLKIFDETESEPIIEHFQASRGEFNWRRVIRKSRQVATYLGATASVALIWYLAR